MAAGTLVLALLFVAGAVSSGPPGLLVRAGAAAGGAAAAAAGCALVAGAAGGNALAGVLFFYIAVPSVISADTLGAGPGGGAPGRAGPPGPDAGWVTVAGVATGTLAARALLGYAPEAPVFPPTLSVREVLGYLARFHAVGIARRGLVAAALERSGLASAAERRAAGLPLPLVRRLALAQAVLGHRRVLLLDETLSGVDAGARRTMCERVRELAASGVAVLLAAS